MATTTRRAHVPGMWWRIAIAGAVAIGAGLLPASASASRATSAWSIVTDPHPGTLTSVSGTGPNDVWAAGYYYDQPQGRYRPLVEHYDGTRFTATVAPTATHGYNAFNGVAAAGVADVWAVGYHTPVYYTYIDSPLIEHFDGTAWRVVKSPFGGEGELMAALALAPDDVWAVGTRTANPYGSLILHWNGAAWSVLDDGHSADGTFVNALTAGGPSDVWVGGETVVGTKNTAFAEHWDGHTWTMHVALPGQEYDAFNGIALDGTSGDVLGVGWQTPGLGVYQMSQRFDGTSWTMQTLPGLSANNNLYGVATSGATAWAVGYGSKTGVAPLVERWDGTAWRAERLPQTSGLVTLYAVTVVGSTVWAVGDSLILRRST